MTATTTFARALTAPRISASKSVWKTGVVAGFAASAATVAVAATASAVNVPMSVGGETIPLAGFAQLTLVGTIMGTVLAAVLSRRAGRPQHTFVVTTLVLTALSIVPDVLADARTATRVVLALTHVVAAAIVIPTLASRLAHPNS